MAGEASVGTGRNSRVEEEAGGRGGEGALLCLTSSRTAGSVFGSDGQCSRSWATRTEATVGPPGQRPQLGHPDRGHSWATRTEATVGPPGQRPQMGHPDRGHSWATTAGSPGQRPQLGYPDRGRSGADVDVVVDAAGLSVWYCSHPILAALFATEGGMGGGVRCRQCN